MSKKNFSSKKAVYSKHIFPSEVQDPIHGFLLIDEEKVDSIIPVEETTFFAMKHSLQQENYEILEFPESYIIPGIIDTNVNLNSNFEENWQDISKITQMAASGGITTIIDHPCLVSYSPDFDEQEALKQRIDNMQGKLTIDCGVIANITAENLVKLPEIFNNDSIIGGKFSLQPPFLSSNNNKTVNIKQVFEQIATIEDFVLFINAEKANAKDLFPTSPCRTAPLSKRLDSEYEISKIKEVFAGGFSHSIGQEDDSPLSSNKSDSEEDKEIDEIQEEIIEPKEKKPQNLYCKKSNFAYYMDLNSSELKKKSNALDEKKTFENLRNAELSGYQHEDLGCINEFIEEEQEMNYSTDEELKQSEDESFSHLNELEEENENSNKLLPKSNINLSNSFPENQASFNEMVNENEQKKPLKIVSLALNKSVKFSMNPLIQQLRLQTQCESENLSSKNSESNASPPNFKKKRYSLLDRRNFSPSSSPLLPFSLEVQTAKVREKTVFNKQKSNNDTDSYEKEIAKKYEFFLANRPANMERDGIKSTMKEFMKLETSQKQSLNIIFSNVSLSSSLSFLKEQKKTINAKIFTEIGCAFLCLHDKKIKPGGCQFKSSPPIRDKENLQFLRAHFLRKHIELIGSAHLRVPPKYKFIEGGNFRRAFSGLSSIGANLHVAWTILYSGEKTQKSLYNEKIRFLIKVLCVNPAKILKIQKEKGSLSTGKDADFVVWNPFEVFEFKKENIFVKDKDIYVFKRRKFYGKIMATFCRGKKVFESGSASLDNDNEFIGKIIKRRNF